MINSTYLGLSAQLALQRRLDTIANNIANASTAGFRAEQIRFATSDSSEASPAASFAAIGNTYLVTRSGEITRTDNPFDLAIDGDAWLGVTTPLGTAYSRDGRLQMTADGGLQTLTGHAVLDPGGTPIRLDPTAGPPSIARDGSISQGQTKAGSIGLFTIGATEQLTRGVDATVTTTAPGVPLLDQAAVGLRQGFVERSNVNAITEMSRLILDQRLFEAVSGVLSETDQTKQEAIRTLGYAS